VSNFNLALLSWSLFMTPGKNCPETEWICWLPFPRFPTFLLLIDVNVKNRWSQSRNIKDLGESLRMCLYAPQTRHLQKVFCVGGGKYIQSHKALPLSNDFAMSVLQFCVCQARAIGRSGQLEQLFLKAVFKCAPTNARKNQCAKKTSRLFKGDS